MDNYEPKEYHFDIKDSADAQFNNIQYMYIGKNETMHDGFIGCVSRVEFDDIYPLKLLFQESGPPNVRSIGSKCAFYSVVTSAFVVQPLNKNVAFGILAQLTEDFCGVEPVTHPPIEVETRPPPLIDEDKLRKAYSRIDSVVLGGLFLSNLFCFNLIVISVNNFPILVWFGFVVVF